ncbi:MAG: TIGR02466 family protein [Beijerinckiaceae bacterium]
MTTARYFATRIYRARLSGAAAGRLNDEIEAAAYSIAEDDTAGQRWCEENAYLGYTSYASLDDLPWRFPSFAVLKKHLDRHVAAFVKELEFDLRGGAVVLDDLWINILPQGGTHSGHLHPNSVISGTYYVAIPKGASAIRFEDPRHAMMMAAPPRRASASTDNRNFIYVQPEPRTIVLWESWLRHEVPMNMAEFDRVSVSFNYRWDRSIPPKAEGMTD